MRTVTAYGPQAFNGGTPLTVERISRYGNDAFVGMHENGTMGTMPSPISPHPYSGNGAVFPAMPHVLGSDCAPDAIRPKVRVNLNWFSPIGHRGISDAAGVSAIVQPAVNGGGPFEPGRAGRPQDGVANAYFAWLNPAQRPLIRIPMVNNRNRRGSGNFTTPQPVPSMPIYPTSAQWVADKLAGR